MTNCQDYCVCHTGYVWNCHSRGTEWCQYGYMQRVALKVFTMSWVEELCKTLLNSSK
jgi:hypothetical protein